MKNENETKKQNKKKKNAGWNIKTIAQNEKK